MVNFSAVLREKAFVHTGIERRDRAVDDLESCSAATALKRDGRVLFVSSADGHGDGLGAQQAKDTGQDVVAPVLAFEG